MKAYRRNLRKRMTAAEIALWNKINKRQLADARFLRQYSIGRFIVDFYCPKLKLAIEVDGEIHNDPEQQFYDEKRTYLLKREGVSVLRFKNDDVFDCQQQVLEQILNQIELLRQEK